MGGDAELGVAVHVVGANLHFYRQIVRSDDGGMQRAVVVALGACDVVVEFFRDRAPQVVHHAQGRVAVLDVGNQHAQRAHIVDVVERKRLLAHLVVDAVDMLGPSGDVGDHVRPGEPGGERGDRIADIVFPLRASRGEHAGDPAVHHRLHQAKCKILKLPFELPDAEAIGEWRVEIQGFACQRRALRMIVPGSEVTQGLDARREADQHHAHVGHHREQHLAQRLGLGRVTGRDRRGAGHVTQFVQARHSFHQLRNLGAEGRQHRGLPVAIEVRQREQPARRDRAIVQTQALEQRRDGVRVPVRRFAGAEQPLAIGDARPRAGAGDHSVTGPVRCSVDEGEGGFRRVHGGDSSRSWRGL